MPDKTAEDREVATLHQQAKERWKHAGGYKKTPTDCPTCVANIAWFGEIPSNLLPRVLAE